MALPDTTRKRIKDEAEKRGADPAKAIAEAERIAAGREPAERPGGEQPMPGKPVADRLLIGFLPFIKVRELRAEWLGLSERIPDDELTCGEYQLKHGGAGQSAVAPEPEAA